MRHTGVSQRFRLTHFLAQKRYRKLVKGIAIEKNYHAEKNLHIEDEKTCGDFTQEKSVKPFFEFFKFLNHTGFELEKPERISHALIPLNHSN